MLRRDERGPRVEGRNVHYDLCDGIGCPCYGEGSEVLASSHWEMLVWIAGRRPDLLRDAIAEAEAGAA